DRWRRLAWSLVLAYPPGFRRDLGLSLVDALDDRMRARRAAGASALRVSIAAIADTVWNASAAWLRTIWYRLRGVRLKPDATYSVEFAEVREQYVASAFRRTGR